MKTTDIQHIKESLDTFTTFAELFGDVVINYYEPDEIMLDYDLSFGISWYGRIGTRCSITFEPNDILLFVALNSDGIVHKNRMDCNSKNCAKIRKQISELLR